MNILLQAHPDDEILFADVTKYDKIIFVFADRPDVKGFGDKRRDALSQHPLRDKITCLNLTESNYWRDATKLNEYIDNYFDLQEWLQDNITEADTITTHNSYGEYGHADHKLVYTCIMDTVNCSVNGQDPKLYREIKEVYKRNGVWTYYIVPADSKILI